MAVFMYSGTDSSGKQVNGTINAKDRDTVVAQLRAKRIRTTMIRKKPKNTGGLSALTGGVKIEDLSRFTRQFAAMTSAGLPLVQCMDILAEQTEAIPLQEALRKVSIDIQSGNTLADSMRKHEKIFNELYCNMVAAGESSGDLDGILNRLAALDWKSVIIVEVVLTHSNVAPALSVANKSSTIRASLLTYDGSISPSLYHFAISVIKSRQAGS